MADAQNIPAPSAIMPAALDGARIEGRASSLFYRIFGDSYKGHYRGGLAGLAIGGAVGIGIGAIAWPFFGIAALASFTGIGAIMGAEGFSAVGSSAASRASALAEKHARLNDPMHKGNTLGALDDKLMNDGRGYHYEYPPTRDKGKFFFWKSGLVGGGFAAAAGGLMAKAGILDLLPHATIVALGGHGTVVTALAAATAFLGPIGVGAVVFGLLGLTFGISRTLLKSVFNHTDGYIQGKTHSVHGPDIGKAQMQGKENDSELLNHRLKRQKDIGSFDKAYGKKIFWGAVGGRFRGFAAGIVAGALVGGGIGLVAFAVACAIPGVAASLALLGLLTGLSAGICAMFGMKIFADAGTEAGAESTARAIDEEFQHKRILQEKGITAPAIAPEKNLPWFNPKAGLVAGLVGAGVGIAIAPFLGAAILPIIGVSYSIGAAIASSAAISGLVGSTYGLGPKLLQSMGKMTDWVYEMSYYRGGQEPMPQKTLAPAAPGPEKITEEEMAKLREKQNAGQGQTFAQTLANQMQNPTMTARA